MKRREFMKTGALLGAGIATLPFWWQSCQKLKNQKGSVQDMESLFNITREEMRQLLSGALSNGAQRADLFFEYRIQSSLKLEEDIIKDVSRGIIMGVGIRAVKDDQVGYAHTDSLEFEKMKATARAAAFIAGGKSSAPIADLNTCRKHDLYAHPVLSIDRNLTEKVKLVEQINKAAKQYDSKVTRTTVSITDEMKQVMYLDSEGKYFTDVQPMVMIRTYAVAEKGTRRQGGGSARGGRLGLEFYKQPGNRPQDLGQEAAAIAVRMLEAKAAPVGPQVVVLGPADSGVLLHEAVGHGLEGDCNRKGLSNYSGRIGEKVASDKCTIIDDGHIPNLRGSLNIDDEGYPTMKTVLIEKGILRGYMHDSISARIMRAAPTGNGRRQSYRFPPIPRMTNTYLDAGPFDPQEIIASVAYGVYAKRFGGGQVDTTKGDFTFGVYEAYLIENGKITAPLKDVTLIGNGPEVMNKVSMVGNDMTFSMGSWTCGKDAQNIPVSLGIPTVKVSTITVGGTQA